MQGLKRTNPSLRHLEQVDQAYFEVQALLWALPCLSCHPQAHVVLSNLSWQIKTEHGAFPDGHDTGNLKMDPERLGEAEECMELNHVWRCWASYKTRHNLLQEHST
jgi:hypothetical protein